MSSLRDVVTNHFDWSNPFTSYSRLAWRRGVYLAFLAAFFPIAPQTVRADSQCATTQITDTAANNIAPSINADGTRIAFISNADLTGGNPDGNREIFLFNANTKAFTQISDTVGSESGIVSPSINADGTRVVFWHYEAEIDGYYHNPEVFLFDSRTNTLSQITSGGNSRFASINAAGTLIAFQSTGDFVGRNSDGSAEIFVFDTNAGTFSQITDIPDYYKHSGCSGPHVMSADGAYIAFISTEDYTGGNPDHNCETFRVGSSTSTIVQITNTTGAESNFASSINADGTRIVYRYVENIFSSFTNTIFLYDASTNGVLQITDTAGSSSSTSIDAEGTLIAFSSSLDLSGGNPDENSEIFVFDTNTNVFTQITDTALASNISPSIDADGTHIAFSSNYDITGDNPDYNREIFLANCLTSNPVSSAPADVAVCVSQSPPAKGSENIMVTFSEVGEKLIIPGWPHTNDSDITNSYSYRGVTYEVLSPGSIALVFGGSDYSAHVPDFFPEALPIGIPVVREMTAPLLATICDTEIDSCDSMKIQLTFNEPTPFFGFGYGFNDLEQQQNGWSVSDIGGLELYNVYEPAPSFGFGYDFNDLEQQQNGWSTRDIGRVTLYNVNDRVIKRSKLSASRLYSCTEGRFDYTVDRSYTSQKRHISKAVIEFYYDYQPFTLGTGESGPMKFFGIDNVSYSIPPYATENCPTSP